MAVVKDALFLSVIVTAPLVMPSTAAVAATPVTPCVVTAIAAAPALVPPAVKSAVPVEAVDAVNVTTLVATALVEYPVNLPVYVPKDQAEPTVAPSAKLANAESS